MKTVAWGSLEMEKVIRLGFSNDLGVQVFPSNGTSVQIRYQLPL